MVSMNAAGESEAVTEHRVEYNMPMANFDYSVAPQSGEVAFNNTSANVTQSHWNFGDGTESNEFSPVHTYSQSGTYVVELSVNNGCGVQIHQKVVTVTLGSVNTVEGNWLKDFRLYPNPNPGNFTVEMTGEAQDEVAFTLYDALGQVVKRERADFNGGDLKQVFQYGELPPAVYSLSIQSGKNIVFVKVVIQR
jgi:hypothetical protein